MLIFSKAIKIRILCANLVEIHYYDPSERLETLDWRASLEFFATGRGKGIVDGFGGGAKSLVRQQNLSKMENVVVQCASDFAEVCKDVMPGVTVHLMT